MCIIDPGFTPNYQKDKEDSEKKERVCPTIIVPGKIRIVKPREEEEE